MPELIFLDTHIWFWLIAEEFERFPADWREAIGTAPQVGVLPISGYAIALTEQRGRLELPCATEQWLQEALEPSGISLMLITERALRDEDLIISRIRQVRAVLHSSIVARPRRRESAFAA